ncbi:protein FAR1-RELATED SEQUENCE 5-like [Salvia miltiorrhiza]|uniref:protein FAR1-RELATED SEQUENCE 5-like n=1 Tax=Salvia miltiorrhiza TaxID=226208 RepID=UPI0025AC9767|nr:protein FAR1-RELATED SEQUENCE 5-like [Salvia miltiorrhiza]
MESVFMEDLEYTASLEDETIEFVFPECDAKSKPFEGQIFANLGEACQFYKDYAKLCGFAARKRTSTKVDGTIVTYYMLCNREGRPPVPDELLMPESGSSIKKRKKTSCKVKCMARIIFQFSDSGVYKVRTFNEGHNHTMVPTVSRHLMPVNRTVTPVHQMWITSAIKARIGPMRSFRMYREIVDKYEDIGCTSDDFKNFAHELYVYALDSDAHMILETFKNKKELGNGFQYFYEVDDENRLVRLIWTDETSVKNYKLFGEAVSFDATYNTNRDNHGKCLSFGAAIISREDVDSYSWVLEKFVECVGNAPPLLITDQDPGLKKAVASVWPETRHRYCMWHITIKVAEKLPSRLRDSTEFKTKFGKIVWTDLVEPDVFEESWKNLMDEYDLLDNRWFSDMFDDRSHWIPAYFRDVSMSGLFRTTSLSESENSYFKRFLNKNGNIMMLYMHYCSALEAQRYNYHKITLADEIGVLPLKTSLKIEKHASTIYTNNIFKEVQEEIYASQSFCSMYKMEDQADESIYTVHDNVDGKFVVRHRLADSYSFCSCNLFVRKGILCKHIFLAFRTLQVDRIPDKYISIRWSKFRILSAMVPGLDLGSAPSQKSVIGNNQFFNVICNCIGYVGDNQDLREELLAALIEVEKRFSKEGSMESKLKAKHRLFNDFYGVAPPETPSVLPPLIAKTKGSGAGGRRKSNQEKAMVLAQKPMRNCKKCNKMGHHDSRNCPTKKTSH